MQIKVGKYYFNDWKQYNQNYWKNITYNSFNNNAFSCSCFGIIINTKLTYKVNVIRSYISSSQEREFLDNIYQSYINIYGDKIYQLQEVELLKDKVDQFLIKMSKLTVLL